MIGVVVPAHNEETYLGDCLDALRLAGTDPALGNEPVRIHIVLDACSDQSESIVRRHCASLPASRCRISYSAVDARKVGVARALGASLLIKEGARWLAFTDADTRVSPGWLISQLSLGVDVVCGSVAVDDWSPHAAHAAMLKEHFAHTYNDAEGHHHIHGANLGVSAEAYLRAGGFSPLPCHEDVELVAALERIGARFAWSAKPRVATSARTDARARGGFGDTLLAVVKTQRAR